LVAYTVSLYRAAQGSRKDQPTVPLNISFAVVLYDELLEFEGCDGGEDMQDGDVFEEDTQDSCKAADNQQLKEEDEIAEEMENQSPVEADLSDIVENEEEVNE
jgi:hypothetical protein